MPSRSPQNNLVKLQEMVWSIPNIRAEIMLYLPNRDVISLLTTSKIHFHSAVEKLYEVFPYKEYESIITQCRDRTRKQVYWNAVRTIKLNRTSPPAKWVRYFGPFPNATCIQAPPPYLSANPAMLFRTNKQGHYRFVFQPEESFQAEWELTRDSVIPERIIGIPSAWGYREPINLMLSQPPSTWSSNNESNIISNLSKINKCPDCFVQSLELHVEVDRPAIFQALRALYLGDKLQLQSLRVSDFNAETVDLIHLCASTVEELLVCCNSDTKHPVNLGQILNTLDWSRFTKLRSLHVRCHRGEVQHQKRAPLVPTRGLAIPGQALKSLNINLYDACGLARLLTSPYELVNLMEHVAASLLPFFNSEGTTFCQIRPVCPDPRGHINAMSLNLDELFATKLNGLIRDCEVWERKCMESIVGE